MVKIYDLPENLMYICNTVNPNFDLICSVFLNAKNAIYNRLA